MTTTTPATTGRRGRRRSRDDTRPTLPEPRTAMGRPTLYTAELDEIICTRLASGETLRSICRDPGMPAESTVRDWARDMNHPFAPNYDRARELGYHSMADEVIEIADDAKTDFVTKKSDDGTEYRQFNSESVHRAKLRCDARRWLLAKALPKVYGEKTEIAISGTLHTEPQANTAKWIDMVLKADDLTNVIPLPAPKP